MRTGWSPFCNNKCLVHHECIKNNFLGGKNPHSLLLTLTGNSAEWNRLEWLFSKTNTLELTLASIYAKHTINFLKITNFWKYFTAVNYIHKSFIFICSRTITYYICSWNYITLLSQLSHIPFATVISWIWSLGISTTIHLFPETFLPNGTLLGTTLEQF